MFAFARHRFLVGDHGNGAHVAVLDDVRQQMRRGDHARARQLRRLSISRSAQLSDQWFVAGVDWNAQLSG